MPTAAPCTSSPAAFTGSFRSWYDDSETLPRRLERIRARHCPGIPEAWIAGAVDQLTRTQRRIEPCKRQHLGAGGSLREMDRLDLLGMLEACSGEQFRQRVQRGVMIIVHPLDLVRHHQRSIARWILRRNAGRA